MHAVTLRVQNLLRFALSLMVLGDNGKFILNNQKTAKPKILTFFKVSKMLCCDQRQCSDPKFSFISLVFSKFWTHDHEVLSHYYEKAPLLSIDNIAAKFEDAVHAVVTEICSGQKSETPARRHAATGHNNNPNACRLWVKKWE